MVLVVGWLSMQKFASSSIHWLSAQDSYFGTHEHLPRLNETLCDFHTIVPTERSLGHNKCYDYVIPLETFVSIGVTFLSLITHLNLIVTLTLCLPVALLPAKSCHTNPPLRTLRPSKRPKKVTVMERKNIENLKKELCLYWDLSVVALI